LTTSLDDKSNGLLSPSRIDIGADTRAPRRASSTPKPRPMPLPALVTTATAPWVSTSEPPNGTSLIGDRTRGSQQDPQPQTGGTGPKCGRMTPVLCRSGRLVKTPPGLSKCVGRPARRVS